METGFKDIDDICHFIPGDVVVIGARSQMGKSTLMKQIATNAAARSGRKVDFLTLESNANQLYLDMVTMEAQVDRSSIKANSLQEFLKLEDPIIDGVEYQSLVLTAGFLESEADIHLHDRSEGSALAWIEKDMPDNSIVFLDYLQAELLGSSLTIDTANAITMIKKRALETKSIIFVASQLTKKVDEVVGHIPRLGHLPYSSALEEVPDKILLLRRREYYDLLDKSGMADITVAKNRGGRCGTVDLTFRKSVPMFATFIHTKMQLGDDVEDDFEAFNPKVEK